MSQSDLERLEQIPKPSSVPVKADKDTKKEIASARRHPVVMAILLVVGAIGVLLVGIAVAVNRVHSLDPNSGLGEGRTGEGQANFYDSLSNVEDLILGLGVELTASCAMLYLILYIYDRVQNRVLLIGIITLVSVLLAIVPQFCNLGSICSSLAISFGVEVMGAVIIFVMFDSVVEALALARSE